MGLTFFKIKSPYAGDITKFCSLNGIEIDRNFLTLEGLDIVDIQFDGEDLILIRKNGEKLRTHIAAGGSTSLMGYQEMDNPLLTNVILPCTLAPNINTSYTYIRVSSSDYEGIAFNELDEEPTYADANSHLYVRFADKFYRRQDYGSGSIFMLEGTTSLLAPNPDKYYFYNGYYFQYFKDINGNYHYGQAIITDGMMLTRAIEMLERMAYNVDAGTYN